MQKKSFALIAVLCCVVVLERCSTPPQTEKEPPKPELAINVGSINLSNFKGRLEKKDISAFARALKKEQIEILAVQAMTRYPGVETRIDLLKELSSQADMRNVFGEMINNSGRQTGNAVFSTFPFHSNLNKSFDGIPSANFEAALQAVVDGGVYDIVVVSAQFPPKATPEAQSACVKSIVDLNSGYEKNPIVVAGNLPSSEPSRVSGSFDDTQSMVPSGKNASSRIWYSGRGVLKPLSGRTVETDLGTVVVVKFGLFRQLQP